MPLILPGNVGSATAATGFDVANSAMFDGTSAYMHKTPGSGPSSADLFTISVWVKRCAIGSSNRQVIFDAREDAENFDRISINSDVLEWKGIRSDSQAFNLTTSRVFRDPSAWYHLHFIWDSADGTANNRMRIYVNGVQETSFGTRANPSSGLNAIIGANGEVNSVGSGARSGDFWDGYMAEFVYLDGQELTPDGNTGEFDSDSGIWKPIKVSGLTFGTNGFYLDFEDSGNLGNDANGGTDLTEVGFAAADQSTDTCTNNFATMNSLAIPPSNAPTFAEGNTKVSTNNANANPVLSTIGVSQGKWYAECKRISFDSGSADDGFRIGFGATYVENVNLVPPGISNSGHYFMIGNGIVYNGSTDLGDKAGDSNISDDGVVGIALDLDNNRISWSFDGVWMTGSNAWSGSSPSSYVTIESGKTYFFLQTDGSTGRGYTAGWNFGGTSAFAISSGNTDANGYGNFETAPPSGYFALNTKNLAEYG